MEQIILFIFLILFPFGQLIRIGVFQPLDALVGIAAVWAVVKRYQKPEIFKYVEVFLTVAVFSWIFSIFLFQRVEVLYGALYLLRLTAYLYFLVFVWNFAKKKAGNTNLLSNALLSVSIFTAIFGWLQYFIYPDTRSLFLLGWDDHLFRLIGTFLDPAFIGLIVVFGLLISVYRFIKSKNWKYGVTSLFLILTLAFTYSRASYLAFFAGLFVLLFVFRKFKYFLVIVVGFVVLMFLLPIRNNTILFFTREFSAVSRLQGYVETIGIFKTSPVFGVGYDNLCLAREKEAGFINYASHACSGSDSSLLVILATTGVVGLMAFALLSVRVLQYMKGNVLFISAAAALFVHSLFNNSLFYPWIMGYLAILLAVGLRSKIKG